jgi:MCP family monocarboxylic acid transporter-like MFS transporter 10
VSAVEIGVSKDFSFYILAIANASAAVGRVFNGIMGDKFGMSAWLWTKGSRVDILIGPMNAMALSTFLVGIMTFAWPFAKNEIQLITIASIYGYAW